MQPDPAVTTVPGEVRVWAGGLPPARNLGLVQKSGCGHPRARFVPIGRAWRLLSTVVLCARSVRGGRAQIGRCERGVATRMRLASRSQDRARFAALPRGSAALTDTSNARHSRLEHTIRRSRRSISRPSSARSVAHTTRVGLPHSRHVLSVTSSSAMVSSHSEAGCSSWTRSHRCGS